MPNGVHAMASISVSEGRANRIADYTQQGREASPRGRSTMRAQEARARAGIRKRQRKAKAAAASGGRGWTHGAGTYKQNLGFTAPSERRVRTAVSNLGIQSQKRKPKAKSGKGRSKKK